MPHDSQRALDAPVRTSKLWQDAIKVLKDNDLGGWTKPAPKLYPHQWSWDSAFIAIGLSHVDVERALRELETLFNAQWRDGRVPHIVFNPDASDYFPGPDRWSCSELSKLACATPATSGLIQPPVHALAAWRVCEADDARGSKLTDRIKQLYAKLMQWHGYLAENRDPDQSGLISIYHPWESGTDNSPRWDDALSRVVVGAVPPYTRRDTKHVADPSERPSQAEYDRYLWLVECLKKAKYDDAEIHKSHPFIIKDALMSAIFAASNRALFRLSTRLNMPESDRKKIQRWEDRARQGLIQSCWDGQSRLVLDTDYLANGKRIQVSTCAGLSTIVVPDFSHRISTTCDRIMGNDFAGNKEYKFAVVPSTTPGTPGYNAKAYWRGPSWPVINWLYWHGMREHGFVRQAEQLREANLALLKQPDAIFGEYFECVTGKQLGSPHQSWTAAVALDWLAQDDKIAL